MMKKLILLFALFGIVLNNSAQDKKISELSTASTTIGDSSIYVIVQSSTTKKQYFVDLRNGVWQDLDFKRNGTGITENFWIGYDAGSGYSSGEGNVSFGGYTMTALSGGNYNSALSPYCFRNLTSGDENSAIGFGAGYNLTTGSFNFFGGGYTGFAAQGLSNITAVGYKSAYTENTSGNGTYFGYQSGYTANGALGASGFGYRVLRSMTSGDYNTGFGYEAGYSATTAAGCIYLGYQAGYSNTTSNFLYIENSNSETPLIGGNFSTDRVGINLANASLAHTLDVGGIVNSTGGYYVDASARIDGDGFFKPTISSDAAAPVNSIYYSTTQSKLVYKDSGGGVNVLY